MKFIYTARNIPNKVKYWVFVVVVLISSCDRVSAGDQQPTLTAVIQETPASEFYKQTFTAIWNTIDQHYIHGDQIADQLASLQQEFLLEILSANSDEAFAQSINSMLAAFPEFTVDWVSREERLQRELASEGQAYQGIGAFVAFRDEPAPHLILLEVMAESPAEYAGLQDRDSIFAIDGVPTTSEKGISDIQRMRGQAGSTVTLSISSPGGQIRDVVVTRGAINPLPQRITMHFMAETAVVYSAFPRLGYEGMDIDFLSIYQILAQERDITGLIIDLRISSTGPTWPLSTLLSVFADGTLGHSKKVQEEIATTIIGKDYYGSQSIPVVILIGPETMGQPEIFAASMQYANRAIVLGLPTLGLVEGADIFPMPDGSQLSLATITFITAAGRDLGLEGVEPDMSIDRYWETIDPNNDMIINQALNILQGSE